MRRVCGLRPLIPFASEFTMTSHFSVPSDWYETFFTGPVLRFWDTVVPPAATEADVAFITRHIGCRPPSSILDVPCGTGRHALLLAQAGFTVTGFDLSAHGIERARSKAQAQGLAIQFQQANMLEIYAAPADGLICMGNSLGYFEPALTQRLFGKFASLLRPGGRLIIDTGVCAETLLPLAPSRRHEFPGGSYEQEFGYDTARSMLETRAQLTLEGERHELLYRHFVMTSGELVRMLGAAGFGIVGMFGDAQDAPFKPGSSRLLLVAQREE